MSSRIARPTLAVLLRSVAYGEADRIVTLLTEAHGAVALMARSARKSQKRFGAALEPFALIQAEVALGSGEVGRLAAASIVRGYPGILGSLERMQTAGAAIESVRVLVPPGEPEPRVLALVIELFEQLDRGESDLLGFELRLLALLGLSPMLDACASCGRPALDQAALFDPVRGAIVCRACGGGPIKLSASTRLRMIESAGKEWAGAWSAKEHEEARAAVSAFVARHTG